MLEVSDGGCRPAHGGGQAPDGELGWFLREKLGLDPLRKQLLDTALANREDYNDIESESLRLFKDLHDSDPLIRRAVAGKFFGPRRSSMPSSAASTASFSSSSRAGSLSSFGNQLLARPTSRRMPRTWRWPKTEDEETEAVENQEATSLKKVLQTEAEVLAAELEEAAEAGAEDELLEGLEASVEAGAEALVSMQEARSKLQAVRRDRGYQAPTSSGPSWASTRPANTPVKVWVGSSRHPRARGLQGKCVSLSMKRKCWSMTLTPPSNPTTSMRP